MKTVLVVDDSKVDQQLAAALLQEAGFRTETADEGRAALACVERGAPDVVLTDLQMPGMDGLELVEAIRARCPGVPVVLVTAFGSEEIAAAALRAGAASYVPKRNLHSDLASTLARVLDASAAGRPTEGARHWLVETSFRYELDSTPAWIQPVVAHLQAELTSRGICDETAVIQVGVALNEALANALHHGNLEIDSGLREEGLDVYFARIEERRSQAPYGSRKVLLRADFRQGEAVLVVRDEGKGFDPGKVADPCDAQNLARLSGRGLMLIRTFMDEVRHNDRGNEITMVKRRPPAAA
jgi:CheY-like chemotaxis protein/anti-sigma regulatory factor (Ser/Thr protein kinase)